MKNNAESMPNEAQEAKRPDISDDDIEQLMKAFEEKGGPKTAEEERRAQAIDEMIGESLGELEKGEKEKEKGHRVEQTGIVYAEAAKAAEDVVEKHLKTAMQMLEADPSIAVMTLLTPTNEHLRSTLDPSGGFEKLHEDPLKQQLYDVFARRLQHEAASAVKTALQKKIDSIGERLQSMEASDESRALGAEERRLLKLQELIAEEDAKGPSARDDAGAPEPEAAPETPKKPEPAKRRWYQVWKR